MALDKLVDSAKLDATLAAEANAIRAKTGGSSTIAYDFENNKGFADAIADIPSGITPTGTLNISANDTYDVTQYASAVVNVPASASFVQGYMPASKRWTSVCYGNGKFVAVSSNSSNYGAYSTDGINWTATTLSSSSYWISVCYGNGKFVAVDNRDTNEYAYSADGITWQSGTFPISTKWNEINYVNGMFFAIGSNGNYVYSTDGINWTAATFPITHSACIGICYGNGLYIAYGFSYYDYATSVDGINWTRRIMPFIVLYMAFIDGKFIANGHYNTKCIYSYDGITWTQVSTSSQRNTECACSDGNVFVACVGDYDYKKYGIYSYDGITWNSFSFPCFAKWFDMCYGNGKFVAVVLDSNIFAYCNIQMAIT